MSFKCLRCGNCCRQPGEVRLAEGEPEAIATALELDVMTFTERHTRLREDRCGLALLEHADGTCIFLEDSPAVCRVETAKPRQCRDFPTRWRYADMTAVCAAASRGEPM